jgi:hypothetical protein
VLQCLKERLQLDAQFVRVVATLRNRLLQARNMALHLFNSRAPSPSNQIEQIERGSGGSRDCSSESDHVGLCSALRAAKQKTRCRF